MLICSLGYVCVCRLLNEVIAYPYLVALCHFHAENCIACKNTFEANFGA